MIKQLDIHNFKIHTNTSLKLSPLTILTGTNASGKSSVTQSLLMLRESVVSDSYPKSLKLNGDSFNVGGLSVPLINWHIDGDKRQDIMELTLNLDSSAAPLTFSFRYPAENSSSLPSAPGAELYDPDHLKSLELFNDNFQYLSAFRYGPKDIFPFDSDYAKKRQVSKSMGQGEYAAQLLEQYGDESISVPQMALGDDGDLRLATQAARWMARISPNLGINTRMDGNQVKVEFTYPGRKRTRASVTMFNTGFGISYSLAVIVAILVSRKNGIVLLENPEAHIHPGAQSALMELVCRAAAGGVQIVIETHSDHIVYGALVNLKLGVLGEKPAIYHFNHKEDFSGIDINAIHIGDDCRIKRPPRDFVEQMNLDLDVLFDD